MALHDKENLKEMLGTFLSLPSLLGMRCLFYVPYSEGCAEPTKLARRMRLALERFDLGCYQMEDFPIEKVFGP